MSDVAVESGAPQWIAPLWEFTPGRDPLGLQTTTTDRLMPLLLPGIIELSEEARYFAFYAFLLAEYQRRRLPASRAALDRFVRRAEWDYGLGVLLCGRCESGPQGARRLRPVLAAHDGDLPRGESVQSTLGGYGLYYRAPMVGLGLVARAGTLLGEEPLPIDVLDPASTRAQRLAATFREAIAGTDYYRDDWLARAEPLPRGVVLGYGAVGCLCRLGEFAEEQAAVHDALFGRDPVPSAPGPEPLQGLPEPVAEGDGDEWDPAADLDAARVGDAVAQRGRSVAHFLTLIDADAAVVDDIGAFRQGLWAAAWSATLRSEIHRRVAGQWAGLVAKDVWQEALCGVWSAFCRAGLARTRELGRALDPAEVEAVARELAAGPPRLPADTPLEALVADLTGHRITVRAHPGDDAALLDPTELTVEQLRMLAVDLDSATAGLLVALELARRTADRVGPGWDEAVQVASAWQPAIGVALAAIREQVRAGVTVGDMLWWLTRQFVLPVHERIGYSKLPPPRPEFTFRFRWEDGRLQFYDHGVGRFPLAAARHRPLSRLTHALGLWSRSDGGKARVTDAGRAFIDRQLAS